MAYLIPDNLKSRKDVPSGIHRAAQAFQVGLDEDVTVWYEPLYDPSGEKPHLVLLFPNQGIVVLEALELGSGGILGALRGRMRIERDGREVELENPLVRAKRLAGILKQRINAEPRLANLDIRIGAGAVFPSLDRKEADSKGVGRIVPLDACLFRHDLDTAIEGKGEAGLLRAFTRILEGAPLRDSDDAVVKLLRGVIQPETVIDRVAEHTAKRDQLTIFLPPEEGDIIRVMDRQQESMAKSLGEGHRVIRGVAGSGKTLILVYRARLLAGLYPKHRILVTCFTKSLAGQLRYLLSDHSNVDVINLDKIMSDVIRAARMKFPGYGDENGDQVADVALAAYKKIRAPRYHTVLVDEAQDFSTKALQFIVGLIEDGHDDLVVVADAAQNIFGRRFSWKQAGIQAQGRTRILRVNYRNTKQILQFASAFLLSSSQLEGNEIPDFEDETTVIPPESAAREGRIPEVHFTKDVQREVERIIEIVDELLPEGGQPRSLAILYGTSRAERFDRAKAIYEGLRNRGRDVFWLSNPNDKMARDRLAFAREPIILSTIHGAKGLEFPGVVLCGLWREDKDNESNRKLDYVGMTRATERLAVVSPEDFPLGEDLKAALKAASG